MSDYIKKDDAKELCFKLAFNRYENIIDGLNSIPSVDVVEVIRCKDCKNYEHIVTAIDNKGNVTKECDFCNHWKRIINVDDFCSYGKRKAEE